MFVYNFFTPPPPSPFLVIGKPKGLLEPRVLYTQEHHRRHPTGGDGKKAYPDGGWAFCIGLKSMYKEIERWGFTSETKNPGLKGC
jgi:hypothetical protein